MKIAYEEKVNRMSAQNLSVCFGPVFMWSPEESLAAIHDVKLGLFIGKRVNFFPISEAPNYYGIDPSDHENEV